MARNSAAVTAVRKAPIVPFGMVEDAAPMKTWGGVRTYYVPNGDPSATVSIEMKKAMGNFNESTKEDIPGR